MSQPDDPQFEAQIEILRKITLRGWWLLVGLLWLTVGTLSLWGLRYEIHLWMEYFTWAAVRYGLVYNRLPSIGLGLCLGMTLALLVSESRHILFGLSQGERLRLENQLHKIRRQGPSHPLWKWVCRDR